MIQIQNISKPDVIGATTSSLCAIHCMITPFIFIAKAGSSVGHIETPVWYHLIDYLFIVISFAAIFLATKNSTRKWVRTAMWVIWTLLLLAILNEGLELTHLPEASVYIPALVLSGLHLYNRKYCQCSDDSCCTANGQEL